MTLSFTQDRLGPLCRAVEDCAVVLHAIARPDGQDFSVTERVFEWDGGKDFRKLRVGYVVDAFDQEGRNEDWRRNDRKTLDDLRALGVKLLPFTLPAMPTGAANGGQGVEAAAAFDDLVRSRRNPEFSESTRANGYRRSRLSPAVDYIQAQRVRGIIARQLADATEPFDVYVAPYIDIRNLPGRGQPAAPPSALMTNFTVANMCGYPAVALPNGFTAKGPPTSITFIGRPYAEAEMLLLAKAYQDATHWHEKHPVL
jgi:Asp-tRNA(Asn)/Glu-tRNA(Gln) amidotransferase A subunit family amidase